MGHHEKYEVINNNKYYIFHIQIKMNSCYNNAKTLIYKYIANIMIKKGGERNHVACFICISLVTTKGGMLVEQTGKGAVAEAIDHTLTEKLLDTQTAEQLIYLLDKLENVTYLIEMLEHFFRRGPEIADSINDLVVLLRQSYFEPQTLKRFENVFSALQRMQEFLDSPQVQELFKSDVLDVRAVQVVGKVSRSMIKASEETAEMGSKRVGIVGLMRMLTDPEVQPALNFFLHFARNLSKELGDARTVDRSSFG